MVAARSDEPAIRSALMANAGLTTRAGPRVDVRRAQSGTTAIAAAAATMNMVGSASGPKVDRKKASRTALLATCSAIMRSAAPPAIQPVARPAGRSTTRARRPAELDRPPLVRQQHVGHRPGLGGGRHVSGPPLLGPLGRPAGGHRAGLEPRRHHIRAGRPLVGLLLEA